MVRREISRKLNLGSGRDLRPGYLNVDRSDDVGADLVWDLSSLPLPFEAGAFDEILALDVVEHLDDVVTFMEEVHRLLSPGGTVRITTPHFSSANTFTDPTHRQHLGYFSFDYFLAEHPLNHYSWARFEIVSRFLAFRHSFVNRFLSRWANRHPFRYEQRWAWLFPAWFLDFRLRKEAAVDATKDRT